MIWSDGESSLTEAEFVEYARADDYEDAHLRSINEKVLRAGTNLVPYLTKVLLQSDNNRDVATAQWMCQNYGRGNEELLRALRFSIDEQRGFIGPGLRALTAVGDVQDVPRFLVGLTNASGAVRMESRAGLEKIGDASAATMMERVLRDECRGLSDSEVLEKGLGTGFDSLKRLRIRLAKDAIDHTQDPQEKEMLRNNLERLEASPAIPSDL